MIETLAVKYRPSTFEEVCGQSITVDILRKVVENKKFKHVYLFAGDSGCGKTTLARIFAKAINQGIGSPIEVDAASNNGVDNVRAIVEAANQRDLVSEYKIFIIDECHAITPDGWKAFLKGIEEPPEYTIFMFCTTDPNKLPPMILNRMQRYNITKIDSALIKARLIHICQAEGFTNYDAACDLISKNSHGCMRDAIMRLDQCADYSKDLSLDNVKKVLNDISYEAMFNLTWALQEKKEDIIFNTVDKLYASGTDLKNFIDLYLEFTLDLSKYILFKNISITSIPAYLATKENPVVQNTVAIAEGLSWFNRLADMLLELKPIIRYDNSYKSTIEAYLLKFAREVR